MVMCLRFCDFFGGFIVANHDGTFAGHQSWKKAVPGADIQNPLLEAAQLVHDRWELQSVPKRVSRDVGCILWNFSEVGGGLFFEFQHWSSSSACAPQLAAADWESGFRANPTGAMSASGLDGGVPSGHAPMTERSHSVST